MGHPTVLLIVLGYVWLNDPSAPAEERSVSPTTRIELGKQMIATELSHPDGLTFPKIKVVSYTLDKPPAICYEVDMTHGKGWAVLSPADNLSITNSYDNRQAWDQFCLVDWNKLE